MAGKKKTTDTPGAHIAKEKRIESGDWMMMENPLWLFAHRISGSRSKDFVLTYCGIKAIPDVKGSRSMGARCKQCVRLSEAVA